MATLSEACSAAIDLDPLVAKYPIQFSSTLRTAKCAPHEKDLSDLGPSRSPPYRSAPPKMRIFSEMVDPLLQRASLNLENPLTRAPPFWCLRAGEASVWWWIIARLILKLFFISTLAEDGNNFRAFWGRCSI
jgi:hypothetical protein